jgi:predicted  nucleic acid-binding Zn-ribbon protein
MGSARESKRVRGPGGQGANHPGRAQGGQDDGHAERERAELRQLTRELHEAAKEARAAVKELRAAHAEIPVLVDNVLGPYAEKELDGIADQIREMKASIAERLTTMEEAVFNRMSQITTGHDTPGEWLESIARTVEKSIRSPDYVAKVASQVIAALPVNRV